MLVHRWVAPQHEILVGEWPSKSQVSSLRMQRNIPGLGLRPLINCALTRSQPSLQTPDIGIHSESLKLGACAPLPPS